MKRRKKLDDLIAEKIMGWHRGDDNKRGECRGRWYDEEGGEMGYSVDYEVCCDCCHHEDEWSPLHNVEEALEAVEKVQKPEWHFSLSRYDDGDYVAHFSESVYEGCVFHGSGKGKTAAFAITAAILQTIGVEIND